MLDLLVILTIIEALHHARYFTSI